MRVKQIIILVCLSVAGFVSSDAKAQLAPIQAHTRIWTAADMEVTYQGTRTRCHQAPNDPPENVFVLPPVIGASMSQTRYVTCAQAFLTIVQELEVTALETTDHATRPSEVAVRTHIDLTLSTGSTIPVANVEATWELPMNAGFGWPYEILNQPGVVFRGVIDSVKNESY